MSTAAWIALHVAAFLIGCGVVLVRDRIRRGRWLWQRRPRTVTTGRTFDLTSFDAVLREAYPSPRADYSKLTKSPSQHQPGHPWVEPVVQSNPAKDLLGPVRIVRDPGAPK